jgi:hypothetical protein
MATSVTTSSSAVTRAAFCASIRIATALVHFTVQFSMRCGVDLGVVTSGLAAIAPIAASGADLGPLGLAASTINAASVFVTFAPVSFWMSLLPCTIRALYPGPLGSTLDPALRSIPGAVAGATFAVFAPDGTPALALSVPRSASVVAVPVGVEREHDDG